MSEPDEDPSSLPLSARGFDLQEARLVISLQGLRLRTLEKWRREYEESEKAWKQELADTLKEDYIGHHEFKPITRLVYGLTGLILTAVVVALVSSVLKVHVGVGG